MLSTLLRDCWLVIKKFHYIRWLGVNTSEDRETLTRLLSKTPPVRSRSPIYSLYQLIVPHFRLSDHKTLFLSFEKQVTNYQDMTFFVNGVLATENKCSRIVYALSHTLNCQVYGLYNPTNGILLDLLECVLGRTFNIREPIVKSFAKQIKLCLHTHERVFLVGHSQGGIVISNIMKELMKDKEYTHLLSKIHIVTFGSGADEMPYLEHSDHFANEKDFIAQIGVLEFQTQTQGHIVMAPRGGHSFQLSYLPGFVDGKYGTDNELYKLVIK